MIKFKGIEVDRRKRTITANGITVYFNGINKINYSFRIACTLLLAGPVTKNKLVDFVYFDDPDGGPISAVNCVEVLCLKMQFRLKALGLKLYRIKRAGDTLIWIDHADTGRKVERAGQAVS